MRFSRLYPTYLAALLLANALGVFGFGDKFWLGGFIINATMLEDFLGYSRYDNVYWSLTVELSFYLMASCLLILGLHRRPVAIAVPWLLASCVWAGLIHDTDANHRGWWALLFSLDYSPYFAMGIMFFDAARHAYSWPRVGVLLLAMITEFLIAGWTGVIVYTICGLLFMFSISGYLRFLVTRFTMWFGAISYALYLIHRNLGYESLSWLHENNVEPIVAVPITIFGAIMLATMLTYLVEKPAIQIIRHWYKKWRDQRAA